VTTSPSAATQVNSATPVMVQAGPAYYTLQAAIVGIWVATTGIAHDGVVTTAN